MTGRCGAYGLVVHGAPTGTRWLQEQADDAPVLTMEPGAVRDEPVVDGVHAVAHTRTGRLIDVRRAPLTVRVGLPHPGADEYVHPLLAAAAAVIHHWSGRLPLHAGVVGNDRGAVLLLADRGGGKTTTLAALSATTTVLSDDLAVVTSGARVLAGPRCLDLRPDAVPLLGGGAAGELVAVRDGERLRLTLDPTALIAPVVAVAYLATGPDRAEAVPPAERVGRLLEHVAVRAVPERTTAMLDLLPVPTYVVGAARGSAGLSFARDAVIRLLDSHAA